MYASSHSSEDWIQLLFLFEQKETLSSRSLDLEWFGEASGRVGFSKAWVLPWLGYPCRVDTSE